MGVQRRNIWQAINAAVTGRAKVPSSMVDVPVHLLVALTLLEACNPSESGKVSRRMRSAQKLFTEYYAGKRQAGTQPAALGDVDVEFIDLTGGEIDGAESGPSGARAIAAG